jgi:hypothetical protein
LAGGNAGIAPIPFWRRRTIRTLAGDEAIHSKARNFGELVRWNTTWGDGETPRGVIVDAYR